MQQRYADGYHLWHPNDAKYERHAIDELRSLQNMLLMIDIAEANNVGGRPRPRYVPVE